MRSRFGIQSGASEVLQVHVSGPDTADVKTALLKSALLGPATANVEITVAALNHGPQIVNLDAIAAVEQTAVVLDLDATVSDADLDALNGGAGLYAGADYTFTRTSNGGAEDRYGFDTTGALFTFEGDVLGTLKFGGASFAKVLNAPGVLIITFDSAETPATTALANDVLHHIIYTNTSDAPPPQVDLVFQFSEGNIGQGRGAIDGRIIAVQIAPVDDPTTVGDDSAGTAEDTPVTIAVLRGNDSDPDTPLAVRMINGAGITVGGAVTVANGSVTLSADGTPTFTPGSNFNGTASFRLFRRSRAALPVLRPGLSERIPQRRADTDCGWRRRQRDQDFDVGALALSLSGSADTFGVRYTGTIYVATGGSYTFYTTSDDGSALYVDGVMVVNNDFSQIATERSGAVALTAGTHAIEIRRFRRRRRRDAAGPCGRSRYRRGQDRAARIVADDNQCECRRRGHAGQRRASAGQSRRHGQRGGADRGAARSRRRGVGCRARYAQWRCRPLHGRDPHACNAMAAPSPRTCSDSTPAARYSRSAATISSSAARPSRRSSTMAAR